MSFFPQQKEMYTLGVYIEATDFYVTQTLEGR